MKALVHQLARLSLVGPILVFGVWWAAAAGQWISPKLLPHPWETLQALLSSIADGSIATDLGGTLARTLAAFASWPAGRCAASRMGVVA